ncbi:MAG TPA: helix-turn-helix domain-containing protein [Thermomicrobiales bacterium]|jgi:PucR family transcriptional regulator, purine catabolism regulatory protein|nr:helix-turn-helix domain-containing protein [Thermomicrobiales bacterium]
MITVEDVITLALPPGTTVAAGAAGLGREVTWAARIRSSPPAFGHLAGGELVLLPVAILSELDERLQLDEAIRRLAELGVAGAAVLGTIGKPARDAAEAAGLPLLALPKGADVGALERDAARLISERRRAVQHRGQEVLRQLMDLAIAGEPLGDVVQELARISGRPVALEGRDGRLLAYHAAGKVAPSREMIESIVQRDRPIVARWLRTTAEASPADPPTASYELDSAWSRLVAPVIGRDGLLGSVSLIAPRGSATPEDAQVTARGAAACAVVLAREQAAATVRREVELDVLDEVLDGALRSEATLLQQAKRLGHDLLTSHVAVIARIDSTTAGPVRASGSEERWEGLEASIARIGTIRGGRVLWRIRNNSAEFVLSAAEVGQERGLGLTLRDELVGLVRSGGESAISLGVGTTRDGIAGIRRSHAEARQALLLGRRMQGPGHLTLFGDLGVYRLIFAAEGLPELSDLYAQSLGELLAYDRQNNADLISTLDAFFAANGSPKEAAERLGVHRNTVLYRLDRIRDITGYDLDDAGLRLRLQLALHIHLALGESLAS